jgi:Ca2+/Na+ antiporter
MHTLEKVLYILVGLGVIGFFVGSVIEEELVYTLAACVAVWAGIALIIARRKTSPLPRSPGKK